MPIFDGSTKIAVRNSTWALFAVEGKLTGRTTNGLNIGATRHLDPHGDAARVDARIQFHPVAVEAEQRFPVFESGQWDFDFPSEATAPGDSGIELIWNVGCPEHEDTRSGIYAI